MRAYPSLVILLSLVFVSGCDPYGVNELSDSAKQQVLYFRDASELDYRATVYQWKWGDGNTVFETIVMLHPTSQPFDASDNSGKVFGIQNSTCISVQWKGGDLEISYYGKVLGKKETDWKDIKINYHELAL